MRFAAILLLALVVNACGTAAPPRLTPAPSPAIIGDLNCTAVSEVVSVVCLQDETGEIIFQTGQSTTLRLTDFTLTFDSTVWLNPERSVVAALDGSALVAINGTSRTITEGQQLALESDSEPQRYETDAIAVRLLNLLPRTVIASETPARTPTASLLEDGLLPTSTPGGCLPREDWQETYTVRSGDTLLRIADRHNVTLDELTEANCINARALILPGDALRVPINAQPGVPSVTGHFYADRASLPPGECTMIYWEILQARRITLDGEIVEATGEMEVCPGQTTDYTLRVTFNNNVQAVYTLTVPVVLELQP